MYNKDRFFELLTKRKISNKELSSAIGVSSGNISDWKSGKSKPNIDAISNIADYLDCSVDYLLGRENYGLLSETEENLINAYRNHPEMQAAVNKMLDIEAIPEQKLHIVHTAKIAAKGQGTHNKTVTDEQNIAAVTALHNLENKEN